MKKKYTYLAAYDLDKTILSINSSTLVVKASRKMGLMTTRDFLQAIYYSILYKFDLRDANKIVSEMTQWLGGLKESKVIELINLHAIPVMLNLIRPEVLPTIAEHRKNNGKVIILSSAMSYLCNPIANHLEFDDVVSSRLETMNGVFTGKPERRLVFGTEKAVRMKEYCEEQNFSLDTAFYYGDAYTDRFVLKSVGNPVCVSPEIKLRSMAKKRGWKII